MRNLNTRKFSRPNRLYSEPIEYEQDIHHSKHISHLHKQLDPLETMHNQLINKEQLLIGLKRSNNTTKSTAHQNQTITNGLRLSIKSANEDLQRMRQELSRKKFQDEQRETNKMNMFINRLRDSIDRSSYQSTKCAPQPPVMYPVPIPYPFYNYQQQSLDPRKSSLRDEETRTHFRSTIRNDSFYLRSNKIRNRESRGERIKRNMRRWKKVANAVLFVSLLKRFCNLMKTNRLLNFQKLKKSLKSNMNIARQDLGKLLLPFFSILIEKKDVTFNIEENQTKEIKKEKVTSIRKLVIMALEAVKKWTQHASENPKFVESLYLLCKHGNYSCTQPILTKEQLELVCISNKNKYVSADSNLEIATFISIIVIKVLVFNVLLSPSNVSPDLQNDNIIQNLEIIASIIYELALDIQDAYLVLVPKIYQIGNFSSMSWVKSAESLIYNHAKKQSGELISGLKSESWVKSNFNYQKWTQQKKLLSSAISTFHSMMKSFHTKLSRHYF